MAHKAVGRLRGRGEPRTDILDRLLQINPNYRVNFLPEGTEQTNSKGEKYTRPAMWRIYEYQDNPLRRAAGAYRVQRYERWPKEKRDANPGTLYDAQDSLDGYHLIGEFSEEYFGTDRMFQDLREGELALLVMREDVKKAQDQVAEAEAQAEMEENAAYSEFVRETAKDFYNRVKGNAVIGYTPSA